MTPTVIPAIFRAKDEMSKTMATMQSSLSTFSSKFNAAGKQAFAVGRSAAIAGTMMLAPLVLAAREAVKFEDKMSDVAKTTGMEGQELTKFGEDLLQMSTKTRASIDDLATIAEIGGRLGIAQKDLRGFTEEANKFSVALGGDFSGGVESAITEFGKLKNLFADTKGLDVSDSLKKSGSAFNALSSKGVNVEGLTDFSLRVGALPEVFRPSLAATAALGATLQKSGVDAQIASSGFSNFTLEAAKNLPAFAKQMGMSQDAAKELFNTDTATFFAKFSQSLKGVPADQLGKKLAGLKLNSLEVQKAVGAMAGATGTYSEMLGISNDQMKQGTSIGKEYDTKNSNSAAQMAKLKNNMQALAITIGTALLPVINGLVESISPYLQAAAKWIGNNKGLVSTIVKVIAIAGGLAFAISGVAFAIGIYRKAVVIAEVAQKAMNMTMLGTPWGVIIAATAAVAIGAYALSKAFGSVSTAQQINNEVKEKALEKTLDERAELTMLFNQLRANKQGTEGYTTALTNLDSKYPGIIAKYDLAHASLSKLNAVEKDLARNILKRAEAEVRAEMYKESIKEKMRLEQEGPSTMNQILGAVGGGTGGYALHVKDIQEQQQRISVLGGQVANDQMQAANPELAKQQAKEGKQIVEFTFNGLPDWMKPSVSKSGSGSIPVMPKNV